MNSAVVCPPTGGGTGILQSSSSALDDRVHYRLMGSGLVNYGGTLTANLVGLFLVPFVLRRLGVVQYGVWIAVSATAALLGTIDLGTPWSVPTAIAAAKTQDQEKEVAQFVNAAAWANAGLGVLGALILAIIAWMGAPVLRLDPSLVATARLVLLICAASFFANQISRLGNAMLEGCQRFDVANLLAASQALLRCAAVVGVLLSGYGVVGYAIVQAVAEYVLAISLILATGRLKPWLRLRAEWPHWQALRRRASYAVASQVNSLLARVIFQPGVIILGAVAGPAATVPLSLGQKFPQAGSLITDRAGSVFLPAASEYETAAPSLRADLLAKGTRWVTALGLPLWIVFMVLGNALLNSWLHEVPHETMLVMRLSATAIFADAIASCAAHFVWGQKVINRLTRVLLITAIVDLVLTIALAPLWHATGVAAAMLLSLVLGSLLTLRVAAHSCQTALSQVLAPLRGLLIPAMACTLVAFAALTIGVAGWPEVLTGIFLSAGTYVIVLLAIPSCAAEAAFVRSVWHMMFGRRTGREVAQ